jgi:hypothetical protein
MNSPDVDRRVTPKKSNLTDEAAEAVKSATMRMPRLWVWIVLGVFFWLIVILVGWAVYANWIAPAALAG